MHIPQVWFKLFASCFLVKGDAESLIYDTERGAFYPIPDEVAHLLEQTENKDVATVKATMPEAEKGLMDDFLQQFVEAELGFFTQTPECFPAIDLEWDYPAIISNAILEFDVDISYEVKHVIEELDELGCQAMQWRILYPMSATLLEDYIRCLEKKRVRQVEILLPFELTYQQPVLQSLVDTYARISRIVLYAAPSDSVDPGVSVGIYHRKKDIRKDPVEIIHTDRFYANLEIFSEAQQHNVGLNRKVCIDRTGTIRNYLNHATTFGNVREQRIRPMVCTDAFRGKWFVSNGMIEGCKTCAYRYACVNNSDLNQEAGKWYKTTPCNYKDIPTGSPR